MQWCARAYPGLTCKHITRKRRSSIDEGRRTFRSAVQGGTTKKHKKAVTGCKKIQLTHRTEATLLKVRGVRAIIKFISNRTMPESVKRPAIKMTISNREQGTRARQSCRLTITEANKHTAGQAISRPAGCHTRPYNTEQGGHT